MATKREVLEQLTRGIGPLAKIGDDEEIFILRARDMIADETIEWWAIQARLHECPSDKIIEANACAARMRRMPGRRFPT